MPDTTAARSWVVGPDAAGAQRFLNGVAAYVTGRAGASNLRGLTLATSIDSWNASRARAAASSGAARVEGVIDASLPWSKEGMAGGAVAMHGWVTLGSIAAKEVRRLAHGAGSVEMTSRVMRALAHELEHTISYAYEPFAGERLALPEEGVAEFMARCGGAQRLATLIGADVDDHVICSSTSYPDQVTFVRDAVDREFGTGVQPTFEQLDGFLQSRPAAP